LGTIIFAIVLDRSFKKRPQTSSARLRQVQKQPSMAALLKNGTLRSNVVTKTAASAK